MQLSLVSSLVLGWAWLKEQLAMPKLIGAALALAGLLNSQWRPGWISEAGKSGQWNR